jgi:chromosome segregation ATPase
MTVQIENMTRRFARVFAPEQATVLAETIHDAYADLVKTSDFNELKEIMRGLAQAQSRTESRMGELAQAQGRTESRMGELTQAQGRTESRMEELAQAQGRTESRMEELAQAQGRTESRMEELAQAQGRTESRMEELAHSQQELAQAQGRTESRMEELAHSQQELAQAQGRNESRMEELAHSQQELAQAQGRTESRMEELAEAQQDTDTRLGKLIDVVSNLAQEVGGLSRSASYALENEAYRQLPAYLKANYDIELDKRLVRSEINDEEVDIFALGQRNGTPIVLVGETKLQMDRRRGGRDIAVQVLEQLERKVEAVQLDHPEREVVRLLVTHYARPAVHEEAQKRNVIVVQSFDW